MPPLKAAMKRSASNNDNNETSRQRARTDDSNSSAMSALFRALETTQQGGMNSMSVDPPADNSSGAASLSDVATTDPEGKSLTYPKPRNFAERLMFVLQKGLAANAIWWVDGKAVALHQKRLKRGNYMQEFFNVKDFSGFIRNCNRWGFRRVNSYDVPDGVVTYQNSLFLKEHPQLVKHMRMDSDIQDIFASHSTLSGGKPNGSQMGDPSSLARLPMELQTFIRNGQQQATHMAPTPRLQSVMPSLMASQQQCQPPPLPRQPQKQQPQPEKELPHQLLRQIMDLSQKYLEHPASTTNTGIRTILQLLNVLGQDLEKEMRQQEERERQQELERARLQQLQQQQEAAENSTADVVRQLAQLIAQTARQQQQQQQQQAPMPSSNNGSTYMVPGPPQEQQPAAANDKNNSQMVLELLGQAALRGTNHTPQSFGNFGGLFQQQGHQQLLLHWAQQQQQQQQH